MFIVSRIKKKARQRESENKGYNHSERKVVWKSKECAWNWFAVNYGIRRSSKVQRFPVWNMSHNNQRSLLFGLGLWYVEFIYHRQHSFNQNRNLPFKDKLWKFYQLIA